LLKFQAAPFFVLQAMVPIPANSSAMGDTQIIPGHLHLLELKLGCHMPQDTGHTHYFSIDDELVYHSFARDFGPLNLGMIVKYCRLLAGKLAVACATGQIVVHCCSSLPEKCSNAALLLCAYQVLVLQKTPDDAFAPFKAREQPLQPFCDATHEVQCTFELTILDCLEGLKHAVRHDWFQWETFNADSYDYFSRMDVGDMNWVIPHRFLAFSGPRSETIAGQHCITPESLGPIFNKINVGLVVRLSEKEYNRSRFLDQGIRHVDLYFKDGTCPPQDVIMKFLYITELEPAAVAVHCKAGLGRTGTLIGLYAMKHYAFPARAFIAWNRMCRPGSILGRQQEFLCNMEQFMFQQGILMRSLLQALPAAGMNELEACLTEQVGQMSLNDKSYNDDNNEDVGQGDRLYQAKYNARHQHTSENHILNVAEPCSRDSKVFEVIARGHRKRSALKCRSSCGTSIPGALKCT
jgi:cell division cycle 14